jgi:hypothetical protein
LEVIGIDGNEHTAPEPSVTHAAAAAAKFLRAEIGRCRQCNPNPNGLLCGDVPHGSKLCVTVGNLRSPLVRKNGIKFNSLNTIRRVNQLYLY